MRGHPVSAWQWCGVVATIITGLVVIGVLLRRRDAGDKPASMIPGSPEGVRRERA